MDYDVLIEKLSSNSSELENYKANAEDIYNEFNSSYLGRISDAELSNISTMLKKTVERLKKGVTNSNTWLKKYVTELSALEDSLSSLKGTIISSPTEFKGEFVDMFGKRAMDILKTGGNIHANATSLANSGVIGTVDGTKLLKYQYNGKEFYIPNTRISLDDYAAYIKENKMYQNAGFQGGQCMLLSQYYASDMLRGKYTTKRAMDSHSGAPAVKMNERCKSKDSQDVLNYVYQEINAGNPVVLQVTQKKSYKGARHLVTMVGYTSDVKSAQDLTPEKILVLDCYDGKVQTLNERNRKLFNQGGNYQALGPTEKFLSSIV